MIHDGIPCDGIQGQGQGHETLKVRSSFLNLSAPPFTVGAGK